MKTTWGADSQITSVAIHRGMAHDSFAVVAVTPGAARSARQTGPHRPERERPPKPRAWYGRGALRVFTRCPRPPGVAPIQLSLAGRPSSAAGSGGSAGRFGLRVLPLGSQVGSKCKPSIILMVRVGRQSWAPSCELGIYRQGCPDTLHEAAIRILHRSLPGFYVLYSPPR